MSKKFRQVLIIFFQKQNKTPLGDLIPIQKPIIGYVGSISDVIDYDLIEF